MQLRKSNYKLEGAKRQHFPYVLEGICSSCGEPIEVDFKYDYLAEPRFGEKCKVPVGCIECGHIDSVEVIPRIALELV